MKKVEQIKKYKSTENLIGRKSKNIKINYTINNNQFNIISNPIIKEKNNLTSKEIQEEKKYKELIKKNLELDKVNCKIKLKLVEMTKEINGLKLNNQELIQELNITRKNNQNLLNKKINEESKSKENKMYIMKLENKLCELSKIKKMQIYEEVKNLREENDKIKLILEEKDNIIRQKDNKILKMSKEIKILVFYSSEKINVKGIFEFMNFKQLNNICQEKFKNMRFKGDFRNSLLFNIGQIKEDLEEEKLCKIQLNEDLMNVKKYNEELIGEINELNNLINNNIEVIKRLKDDKDNLLKEIVNLNDKNNELKEK